MRKRDEEIDQGSCFNRAKPDEWVFVLLGRDAAAPYAVRAWAAERIRLGKNKSDDPQIVEALKWAMTVEAERSTPACTHPLIAEGRCQKCHADV